MIFSRLIFKTLGLNILLLFCALSSPNALAVIQNQTGNDADKQGGIELYGNNRYSEAADILKQVVKTNKEDYEAWHYLGLSLILKQELKDATKCFETVLRLQPQYAAGHAGLAYVLLLRNKQANAMVEAEMALKIDPQIADAYYIISVIRLRAGARDDALKNAENAIKLRPQLAPPYLLKSEALVSFLGDVPLSTENESAESRNNRYREAAEALEKYLQLNPKAPNKDVWMQQLDSLRFFVSDRNADDRDKTVSGKEVTTKVRVLSKPEPRYTAAARNNQVTGTTILRAVFASDGSVRHILIIKALPDGLTEASIQAARKIKFTPATLNGHPVSMWMELQYNFNLF